MKIFRRTRTKTKRVSLFGSPCNEATLLRGRLSIAACELLTGGTVLHNSFCVFASVVHRQLLRKCAFCKRRYVQSCTENK